MPNPRKKRGERAGERSDYDPYLLRAVEAISRQMGELGVTQTALAEKAGVDEGIISRLLSGERPECSFYAVTRLLLALNISIDWAIGDAPPAPVRVTLLPAAPDRAPESSSRPSRPAAK